MRRRRGGPEEEAEEGFKKSITPMLDMTFQLLAFFILTFHPSDLEGQMDLLLPAKEESASQATPRPDVLPKTEEELELEPDLTVIVRTQQDGIHDGIISNLTVQTSSGQKSLGRDRKDLLKYLKEVRKTATNPDVIKLQGDGKLKWKAIVEVMDTCKEAGFRDISFVPPPGYKLGA
jgi:biopolymer transport protein ExbD